MWVLTSTSPVLSTPHLTKWQILWSIGHTYLIIKNFLRILNHHLNPLLIQVFNSLASPLRFLNKTYGRLFIYFELMQNELIQECLDYIKELTDFLKEKGYYVDDSRLEMLQHRYNNF